MDNIKHPNHYKLKDLDSYESIDVIKARIYLDWAVD